MSDPGAAIAALELNDAGLTLAGPPALAELQADPGIAVVEEERIVTGRAAEERARLSPRRVHQSYWAELGLEPLGPPFPEGLRSADLAFAQLEELGTRAASALGGGRSLTGVLLVAPGSFSLSRLGLALSVARRAGWPVTGCVDAAVAAAAGGAPADGGRRIHLDLERNRAVATELLPEEGGRVVRGRVVRDERVGSAALLDGWARAVARQFVRRTRFDPLHAAATEQELYLRLPGWLARLSAESSIAVSIAAGGRAHEIELERAWVAAEAALAYERLADLVRAAVEAAPEPAGLLLSDRLRGLPGLEIRGSASGPAIRLPAMAALTGALRHAREIHHPGVEAPPLIVRLPGARG
ncbi:MAG: hypothetical protein R3325_11070 [Thermoanaerobaculia bacterium]|nr:hypothetical protein [Thermoanaerobaculia bacterium]